MGVLKMNNEQRIKEAFHRLQVEREIYLRVFNSHKSWLSDSTISDGANELSHRRLLKAEQDHKVVIRWEDIQDCAVCGCNGISEEDEIEGDDDIFDILYIQTNQDSQHHNKLLCDECLSNDEHYLENRDVTGRGQ